MIRLKNYGKEMTKLYLVDDDNDWLPRVDGARTPLLAPLVCPLSVDLRADDVVGVLPGVSLGMRLGVVESRTNASYILLFLRTHCLRKTGDMPGVYVNYL